MNEVEVTENSIQNKRGSVYEVSGVKFSGNLGRNGIEDVHDNGPGRDDGNHLVEQLGGIFFQDGPVLLRPLIEQGELMPAFPQRQEEGEEQGADNKPGGDTHVDRFRSGDRPDDVEKGQHHDIDNHQFFQPPGIAQAKHHV